jgi:hypothetical protein
LEKARRELKGFYKKILFAASFGISFGRKSQTKATTYLTRLNNELLMNMFCLVENWRRPEDVKGIYKKILFAASFRISFGCKVK